MRTNIDMVVYTSEGLDTANDGSYQNLDSTMRRRASHFYYDYQSVAGTNVGAYAYQHPLDQHQLQSGEDFSVNQHSPYCRQEASRRRYESTCYYQADHAPSVAAYQNSPPNDDIDPIQRMGQTVFGQTNNSSLNVQPRHSNHHPLPHFHGNIGQSPYPPRYQQSFKSYDRQAIDDAMGEAADPPELHNEHGHQDVGQHIEMRSDSPRDANLDVADPINPMFRDKLLVSHGNTQPWSIWLDKQVQSRRTEQIAWVLHHVPAFDGSHTSNTDDAATSNSVATMFSTQDSSVNKDNESMMKSSQATIRPTDTWMLNYSFTQDTSQRMPTAMPTQNDVVSRNGRRMSVQTYPIATQKRSSASRRPARPNRIPSSSPSQEPRPTRPSPTRSSMPVILPCSDCSSVFTGVYRKGNLGRHRRQNHGIEKVSFPCEDDNCSKKFRRTDARRKHYLKHHSHLISGPCVPHTISQSHQSIDKANQFIDETGQSVGEISETSDNWDLVRNQFSRPLPGLADKNQYSAAMAPYDPRMLGMPNEHEKDVAYIGFQHDSIFAMPALEQTFEQTSEQIFEPVFEPNLEWDSSSMDEHDT